MAELLGSEHSSGSTPTKKADKRKQTILVITGIVGVLLTYLLWRRTRANGTASSQGSDYTPSSSDGGSDSGGGGGVSSPDYSDALNAIGGQIGALQTQLSGDESNWSSEEEKFNSTIAGLTSSLNKVTASNAHNILTLKHLEHNKGYQQKQITRLSREVDGLRARQHAARRNTHRTKRRS